MRFTALALFLASALVLGQPDELPVWATPEEIIKMKLIKESTEPGVFSTFQPPPPVRCFGEFEQLEGVLLTWRYGSWDPLYRELVRSIGRACKCWIIVRSASEQTSIRNYLQSNGVPLDSVVWLTLSNNSVWIRDYGPWTVYEPSTNRSMIDLRYNRPRPQDDSIPVRLAQMWGMPWYTPNLYHPGGNFMVDGNGVGFSTTLIYEENTHLTRAQIDTIMNKYIGLSRFKTLTRMDGEYTGHCDMFTKMLDDYTVMVGSYPLGDPNYAILNANTDTIGRTMNGFGRRFKTIRIPMPPPSGGVYRSYTNSLFVNNRVLVPIYHIAMDTTAMRIYRQALPNYQVDTFDCTSIINSGGAVHCIAMGIPTRYQFHISHYPPPETVASSGPFPLRARTMVSYTRVIPESVAVYWNNTGIAPFNRILMTVHPDTPAVFLGQIPVQTAPNRVYYYVSAYDTMRRQRTHPRQAPTQTHFFYIPATAVEEPPEALPLVVRIAVVPNPFRQRLVFGLDALPTDKTTIEIYDISGRCVKTLAVRATSKSDAQRLTWHGDDNAGKKLPPGVYFYQIRVGNSYHGGKVVKVE